MCLEVLFWGDGSCEKPKKHVKTYICVGAREGCLNEPVLLGAQSECLFVMFNCVFVTFACGILGQVWYLIVSIPDLCRLSNFELKNKKITILHT